MKNMKKLALLLVCLVMSLVVLSSCTAGDPTGSWYMTGVKNDDTGEMQSVLDMCAAYGVQIRCDITDSRVSITLEGEDLMSFNYRLSGNSLVDTADNTEVAFRVSGDTLTLIFEDCDMIFTRID